MTRLDYNVPYQERPSDVYFNDTESADYLTYAQNTNNMNVPYNPLSEMRQSAVSETTGGTSLNQMRA